MALRELWFQGVEERAFERWLASVLTAAPETVRAADVDVVWAGLFAQEGRVVFSSFAPDEGLAHEVAARAVETGVACLAIDGETFDTQAPWAAFTLYQPGATAETIWFDPLRGLVGDLEQAGRWLTEFAGAPGGVHAWALEERAQPRTPIARWLLAERGQVLAAPKVLEGDWYEVPEPAPELEREPGSRVWAWLLLLTLAPAAFVLPWAFAHFGASRTMNEALAVSMCSAPLSGAFSLTPLTWPVTMRPLPFLIRFAWFVGWPVVLPPLASVLGLNP